MTAPITASELLKALIDDGRFEYVGNDISRRDLRTMAHRVKTQLPVGKGIKTWAEGNRMFIVVIAAAEATTRTVQRSSGGGTGPRSKKDPKAPREPKEPKPVVGGALLPDENPNVYHRSRWAAAMAEYGITDGNGWRLPAEVRDRLGETLRKEWVAYGGIARATSRPEAARQLHTLKVIRGEETEPLPHDEGSDEPFRPESDHQEGDLVEDEEALL